MKKPSLAVQLIKAVLDGCISDRLIFNRAAVAACEELPDCAIAIHEAGHFLDDEELRNRDAEYDSLMRSDMEKQLSMLREIVDRGGV